MSTAPPSILNIERIKEFYYGLRAFSIFVDNKRISKIRHGETIRLQIPHGAHQIYVKVDQYISESIEIGLRPGEVIDLECGISGIMGGLKGLFLNSFLHPNSLSDFVKKAE